MKFEVPDPNAQRTDKALIPEFQGNASMEESLEVAVNGTVVPGASKFLTTDDALAAIAENKSLSPAESFVNGQAMGERAPVTNGGTLGDEESQIPLKSDEETSKKDDLMKGSTHGSLSSIWHDEADQQDFLGDGGDQKGNRRLRRFIRENVVQVPMSIATRIASVRSASMRNLRTSTTELPIQSVPIVQGDQSDSQSVTLARGSVQPSGEVVVGDEAIDQASLRRAEEIVCGGESWAQRSTRLLEESKSSTLDDPEGVVGEIVPFMAKSNDDLRQEVFVMQMIHYYKSVFANAGLPLWLRTYRILSTSKTTGLIEFLSDSISVDGLKKQEKFPYENGGLRAYFEQVYGIPSSASFKAAQMNFVYSLAGYAVVSYLLGLKDRHNGNIMLDTKGHVVFIDFGFAMGMAPGHEASMERAAFKLTKEYIEVMDGEGSECFEEFCRLFVEGFLAARANSQIALGLVEIMMYRSNYPCFSGSRYGNGVALKRFEERLMLRVPENKVKARAFGLIKQAKNHLGTRLYDKFQKFSNGYAI
eukprot:CAMPEP_0118715824 /NCGR_PEP_ID=MMETSP0800-20121206/27125_1 /TAXON_ID=210618 ORGANISM="Striatella unipunctata, Strain CCMP2910" /NCGR_SAMPLE_ID=MMETSP0800 /ASSEMBLY_ACC=CAM_ASM_000638 /LENGTH=531 /DNA_ID=CAMNT_0006622107 /DNA_START=166 /DNA_END=1761 /DNA_ORIENTATION=+